MNRKHLYVGENCTIQDNCIVGLEYTTPSKNVVLGNNSIVRAGTIIYTDVEAGEYFQTGHNVMIRGNTVIGDHVTVGTNTVVDGNVTIGNYVKIESNCYIPTHTRIGSRVFIGPNVVMTNDKYPLKLRNQYTPHGPDIRDGVTLGAACIILPGICVGEDTMVAAGAVVTKDVPPNSLVTGNPGRIKSLPDYLRDRNMANSWKKYISE